jgi:predicted DNA-binding protein (UPF0251 family)
MPRPRRFRRICFHPEVTYFKPAGVRMRLLRESVLTVDELEAIRLKDHEGRDQKEAARSMEVSQPTFQRIYESARKKIADALVTGKALRIEGGSYNFIGHRRLRNRGGVFNDRRT